MFNVRVFDSNLGRKKNQLGDTKNKFLKTI